MKRAISTAALLCLAAASPISTSAAEPASAAAEPAAAFAALQAEEAALGDQLGNVTDEQWRDAIRDLHEKQGKERKRLAELAASLPRHEFSQEPLVIEIPAKASAKERQFITEHAALENEEGEIADRFADPEQRRDAILAWREKQAARIKAQQKLGKELAALRPAPPHRPLPPIEIPADATPQIREFLQKKAALRKEEHAIRERYEKAGPEVLRDKLREFHEAAGKGGW